MITLAITDVKMRRHLYVSVHGFVKEHFDYSVNLYRCLSAFGGFGADALCVDTHDCTGKSEQLTIFRDVHK